MRVIFNIFLILGTFLWMFPALGKTLTGTEIWESYKRNPNAHANIPNCSYAGYRYSEVPLPNKKGKTVNVKDFGAKGDDSTDDTEAFKRAERKIESQGGGVLWIPSGTYRISGLIHLGVSKTILRGEGPNRSILKFQKALDSILGPKLTNYDGEDESEYSYFGGLVFVSPQRDFDANDKLVADYNQGWSADEPIAKINKPAKRGDFAVEVDSSKNLRVGQRILLGWKNPADHSLLEHIAGHPLMKKFPWDTQGTMLTKRTRTYWPVEIKKIKATTITLKQPLRIDIEPKWEVNVKNIPASIEEVGIENLSLEMLSGPPNEHLHDKGFNGIFFNRVFHSWVRNVTLVNVDNGILTQATKNITISHVVIKGDRPHHHALYCSNSHDNLFTDFKIESKPRHGINNEGLSSGNVWRRGEMLHGTFDMHRMMPFDFIRTDIKIFNDGRPGGSNTAGPLQGAHAVHWNIEVANNNEWVYQPDTMPMGALVGIRGMPINEDPAKKAMVNGDKGCLIADDGKVPNPADLFEAQLKLRLKK